MVRVHRLDEQDSDTELKFYLPAGVSTPFDSSRFERLWESLFDR